MRLAPERAYVLFLVPKFAMMMVKFSAQQIGKVPPKVVCVLREVCFLVSSSLIISDALFCFRGTRRSDDDERESILIILFLWFLCRNPIYLGILYL